LKKFKNIEDENQCAFNLVDLLGQHCLALSLIQGRKSGAVNLVDRRPYNARFSCQVALKGQNA
jgi:hypothetical protein